MNHSSIMSSLSRIAVEGASRIRSPPGFKHAPVIGQHAGRFGQMLDGVAGMDDVEALAFERRVFDARGDEFGARKVRARIGHAFVGLDGGDAGGIGAASRKARAKLPRLEPTSSSDSSWRQIGVAPQGGQRLFGAEALAIADIAPIGAAGGRGRAARRAVDARQALDEAAMAAKMDLEAAARSLGLIDGLQRVVATEFAMVVHGRRPASPR